MADYYVIPTNIGEAKMANALALGIPLAITELALGDGEGDGARGTPVPDPDANNLVSERRRAPVNSFSVDPDNSNILIAEQIIPETAGGWWIREMGLFDEDGDMIFVCNAPPTYKPQLSEGSGRTQVVRMASIVSDTAAVTLKVDPSVVLATREYVQNLLSVHEQEYQDKINQRVKSVGSVEELKTLPAEDGYQVSLTGALPGLWEFSESDLSAEVSDDTEQMKYIAPNSDPSGQSGAWGKQWGVGVKAGDVVSLVDVRGVPVFPAVDGRKLNNLPPGIDKITTIDRPISGAMKPSLVVHDALVLTGSNARQANPVLPLGSAGAWDEDGVRGFAPMVDENGDLAQIGGEYRAYYSGRSGGSVSGLRAVGLARSTDPNLVVWSKDATNPVLEGSGLSGKFDEAEVATGSAILRDNGEVWLYYAGYDTNSDVTAVGLAISMDGGVTFTRAAGNPVLNASDFAGQDPANFATGVPHVVKTSIGWVMTFEASSPNIPGKTFFIYGATSDDGLSWTPLNDGFPILGPRHKTAMNQGTANPKVMEVVDGKFVMTFNANANGNNWRIFAAFTADPNLTDWTVYESPLLVNGDSDSFDTTRIEDGILIKDDIKDGLGYVRLFYFGTTTEDSYNGAQVGLAQIPQVAEDFEFWSVTSQRSSIHQSRRWGPHFPAVRITGAAAESVNVSSAAFSRPLKFPNKWHLSGMISGANLGDTARVHIMAQVGYDNFLGQGNSNLPGLRVVENSGNLDIQVRASNDVVADTATWLDVATVPKKEPIYFDLYVDPTPDNPDNRTIELVVNDSTSLIARYPTATAPRTNLNVLTVVHQTVTASVAPGPIELGDLTLSGW